MSRRVLSAGSVLIAVIALGVVLANATLIDRRGPAVSGVSLSAPVEGQASVGQTLTAIDIQFSEPVRAPTFQRRFRIEPYVAGTLTWDGSTVTFTPTDKLPPDTEFTVTIEAGFEDLAGNAAPSGVDAYTFRTVGPPTVQAVEPVDGADGVAVDAPVTLTFDRLMDTAAVERAIRIDPEVPHRASWSGRAVSLAFDGGLDFGTTYQLTVGTAAEDTDGSRLGTAFTTEFTTVAAGLDIVTTVPADGGAGISVRTPIAVVFDGPVDPESVEDVLSITPSVGGDVRVVSLPDDAVAPRPTTAPGVVLLLQPAEPLAAHTTYTVQLGPVARLDAPDQVAAARTWRFTTGQPTISAHNHIAYLSTRAGTRDVWLMNPDGSAPRQLSAGLAPVTAFDVTADGSRVVVAAGGEVRTTAIDGSDERVLTRDGRFEYAPRFSPDGRSVLLARREADGTDAGWWVVPLDDGAGDERQLVDTGAPPLGSTALEGDGIDPSAGLPVWAGRSAWDPTGRWVLVTAADGQVALADLESDDDLALTLTGVTAASPGAWSASSAGFVIVGREQSAGPEGLYAIDTNGRTQRVGDAAGSASVGVDGRVVLLVGDPVTHVALRDADGEAPPERLTDEPTLADRWPALSPDGGSVVFGRVRADAPTTSAGIWTVSTSGGPAVALTTDGAYPRWLP
jgi:Tol biopolymer transport system component